MIRNFTRAEWLALAGAVDNYEEILKDLNDQDRGGQGTKLAALERAFEKARQLAPESFNAQ